MLLWCLFLITLSLCLILQHFHYQNNLSSTVDHNGLTAADRLTLGVVKVWGAGSVNITEVTLTDGTGATHPLTPQHNLDTQVSKCSLGIINVVI